ncbi:hypothetical protein ACJDU8_16530 [Clostridium sp. WILCCON 0269]|uniref:Uncharacterized protein n=1 Tax=Candidatus Clostridium eludens TaxID=3381663 RepID=A0ABW8SPN9_9CLOT
MIDPSIYFGYYVSEFEKVYISLIEKELDVFFSTCLKSAETYSAIIANKPSLHNKEIFEQLVLSSKTIENFLENIILKVNEQFNNNANDLQINYEYVNSFDFNKYNTFLENTIKNFTTTQIVTKVSERIVDFAISSIFDMLCPDIMINNLCDKIISGKKVLHKNNLQNQVKRHDKLIYKQIEGLLINVKTNLRNQLIKVFIISINISENMEELVSIA